jgi:hypothetical protein
MTKAQVLRQLERRGYFVAWSRDFREWVVYFRGDWRIRHPKLCVLLWVAAKDLI